MKSPAFPRFTLSALIASWWAACAAIAAPTEVRLPSLFSDHMVLQKSPHTAVWGWAAPGEKVAIRLGDQQVKTAADAEGRWKAVLDLSKSGPGPFDLTVEGKVIKDVLVGQVWLAAGQSNMVFRLSKTIGADKEIAAPENPWIREFEVQEAPAATLQQDCAGQWLLSNPQNKPRFSGVAYYFAKLLYEKLGCPVGMIVSASGGTMVEAWTSLTALNTEPDLKAGAKANLDEAASLEKKQQDYAATMEKWLASTGREDQPPADVTKYAGDAIDEKEWKTVTLPGQAYPQTAAVWLRKTVDLPAEATKEPLDLNLETLTGFDTVYWNGHQIAQTTWQKYPGSNQPRFYTVPAEFLKEKGNILAVRVFSPIQGVGLSAKEKRFRAGPAKLSGDWLLTVERDLPRMDAAIRKGLPADFTYFEPKSRASSLFNGMIHPLIPCTVAGFLWYQGESNAKRAEQYRTALPLLINDWRGRWGQDNLPFYLCQLPNYQPLPSQCLPGGWAELREAQALAAKLPYTALVTLIDVGEEADIHPRNKHTTGERLAQLALARTYQQDIPYSGPVFDAMQIEGNTVTVHFQHTDGGLVAKDLPVTYQPSSLSPKTKPLKRNSPNSQVEGFALCGKDGKWIWADAHIVGETVVVSSPEVNEPVAVRYAWADNPVCNLYNGAGLPASPFRTDNDPLVTARIKYGLTDQESEK